MGQRRDFGQTCGKCPSCGSEYVPEMGEGGTKQIEGKTENRDAVREELPESCYK